MWKPGRTRAEQHFSNSQKKDDQVIKQKEKVERDRDDRMARLRDLRLAKESGEAAEREAAKTPAARKDPETPESTEPASRRLPRVHPHRS